MIRRFRQKHSYFPFMETAVLAVLSLWAAVYAFRFNRDHGMWFAVLNAVLFFAVPCFLGLRYLNNRPLIRPDHRKLIPAVFAVFAAAWIFLRLNNSSFSLWKEFLLYEPATALWGSGRPIRSDEWAIWTPMLFSQAARGYPAVNTAINAASVDPTLIAIGGLPAWNLAAVFKPFYWGFLLFGTETGYSMMTLFRFAALFAVSFLCARRYTRGNRPLSFAAACLITLSPYVQWWYSQSICEVLIFAQLILLCWIRALETQSPLRQAGLGAAAAWGFGCFVMVAYPAWLIPTAYLTAALLFWLVIRRRRSLRAPTVLRTLAPLCVTLALLFFIFRGSWDTLMKVKNSVYPGQRLYTGGNRPQNLFTGFLSLTFPVTFSIEGTNTCELSNFISFAPAGAVMALIRRIRTKKADPLSAILAVLIGIFGLLSFVRLPAWLTQATLLSQCTRPAYLIGLCDLVLLLRALTLWDRKWLSVRSGLVLALACALVSVGTTYLMLRPPLKLVLLLLPVALGMFWLLFAFPGRRILTVSLCMLAMIGGLFVNPVQQGFREIRDLPTVGLVTNAGLDPEEAVIAVEDEWPVPNSLLLAGYKVLDSTQPYADPDRWSPADPDGQWASVYNRLCNFRLEVSDETEFLLPGKGEAPIQTLRLTVRNLQDLGVNTLLTRFEYPALELIASEGEWNLYRLDSGA